MPDEGLDQLLSLIPKIAEAVNQFKSPDVQQRAFDLLINASGMAEVPARPLKIDKQKGSQKAGTKTTPDPAVKTGKEGTTKKSRSRSSSPSFVKDLDLRPSGKKSFRDFAGEKDPQTNHERNAVAIYYLGQILELDAVSIDHVFTAYRDVGWRIPADLANSLALTANRKGWIDSADRNSIRITAGGINAVEHDLPSSSD